MSFLPCKVRIITLSSGPLIHAYWQYQGWNESILHAQQVLHSWAAALVIQCDLPFCFGSSSNFTTSRLQFCGITVLPFRFFFFSAFPILKSSTTNKYVSYWQLQTLNIKFPRWKNQSSSKCKSFIWVHCQKWRIWWIINEVQFPSFWFHLVK